MPKAAKDTKKPAAKGKAKPAKKDTKKAKVGPCW
jgi:hypothetical protein